jgi:superfamily I DNA/RNA helicase
MADLDKYKQAIVDVYDTTNKNIFVNATAGSGKTFTLCTLADRTPPIKSSIFLAFNKSIAQELGARLPRTVKASTLHSCSLSALLKAFKMDFAISENKYFGMARECLDFKGIAAKRINGLCGRACTLYDLMRFNLITDDFDKVTELGERYGVDADEESVQRALELYRVAKHKADRYFEGSVGGKLRMDFTDMLYYAANYIDMKDFKQYNVVMLDECQDISPLQFEVVKRCKTPRGRLIAVGDEKQSIYSFMGSNLDSLHAIKNSPNTIELPLSMTYRCAVNIVDEARKVFPDGIEAAPGAVLGSVDCGSFRDAKDGDFILCRNNAPLMETFIELLKLGKRCAIMGKDYGDELVYLIDSIKDIWGLEAKLEELSESLAKKGVKMPTKVPAYAQLEEKVHVLLTLYEYFGDLEVVRNRIYDIFTDTQSKGVTLSTIHKSKGLEADNVYFLQPDLLPSKYAVTELALYAEKCLKFVAITRSRKNLIYC